MIRKTNIIFIFLFILKSSISQFDLNDYDSLLLWVNGSNVILNGNYVSKIIDNSSLGNDSNIPGVSRQPLYQESNYRINNHPEIIFDGLNDYFVLPNSSNPGHEFSLFMVIRPNDISSLHSILSRAYSNRRFQFRYNNSVFESWVNNISQNLIVDSSDSYIISIIYDGQSRYLNINGVDANAISQSGPITYISSDPTVLGCCRKAQGWSATQFYDGNFLELALFNKAIDTIQKNEIITILTNKYAPALDLDDDITIPYGFCDTTISSPNYYTSYLWSTGATDSSIVVNEPGEYWLEGVDIFGRTTRDTIEVIRPPYDDIQLQNQIVCFNQLVTITANTPTGNYSFDQWSDGTTNPTRILNQNESISLPLSIV